MDTLFDNIPTPPPSVTTAPDKHTPLAERMRPRRFDDVLGQEHLLGEGAPLRGFAAHGLFPSMILWGAPGIGKTTLALIIAQSAKADFTRLSAVEAGVKDVREILTAAEKRRKSGKNTVLFIDEIHRFNKNQQDALLHAVEQGIITLIGATTENPSFEVNPALLSRCRVYTLQSLTEAHCNTLLQRALQQLSEDLAREIIPDNEEQLTAMLFRLTGGDARGILNALESAVNLASGQNNEQDTTTPLILSQAHIEAALQQKTPRYDKKGEGHFDTISAFIKSLRGSDPDAALFWLAVMLEAGEDARFIARRMVIFASEDIGNAASEALPLAIAVFQAVDVIGMPECRINLAHGVTFLASCPKSNASYRAIENALAEVRSGVDTSVPLHLRNAPTTLMKQSGYGREYQYPHNFEGHFVEAAYFPAGQERRYYTPSDMGDELEIQQRLKMLRPHRYE
ncbi:MAG: replication-associated recombination protein A [Candidatus Kapaibacteriota bacterium]